MPIAVVPSGVIADAVHLACRAPSFHNSQPWRFVGKGAGVLHLFLDRDRLVDTDSSGRQALVGCGAVLDHLRVAMAAAGGPPTSTTTPTRTTAPIWRRSTSTRCVRHRRSPSPRRRDPGAADRPPSLRSRRHAGTTSSRCCCAPSMTIWRTWSCCRRMPAASSPRHLAADRGAAPLRFVVPRRTGLVDRTVRHARRDSRELPGVGGRERSRRRRPHLSGHPPSERRGTGGRGPVDGAGAVLARRHSPRHSHVWRGAVRGTPGGHDGRHVDVPVDPSDGGAGHP